MHARIHSITERKWLILSLDIPNERIGRSQSGNPAGSPIHLSAVTEGNRFLIKPNQPVAFWTVSAIAAATSKPRANIFSRSFNLDVAIKFSLSCNALPIEARHGGLQRLSTFHGQSSAAIGPCGANMSW